MAVGGLLGNEGDKGNDDSLLVDPAESPRGLLEGAEAVDGLRVVALPL